MIAEALPNEVENAEESVNSGMSVIKCPTPMTNRLPSIKHDQYSLTSKLSVTHNAGPPLATTNFTFYDCGRYLPESFSFLCGDMASWLGQWTRTFKGVRSSSSRSAVCLSLGAFIQ